MENQSRLVIENLKAQLKLRGMSYKHLAQVWNIAESSVKRIMSSDEISLSRIESACHAMNLHIGDFFKQINFPNESGLFYLTPEQESRLAKEPEVLNYFLLLNEGRSPSEILRDYSISNEKNIRILNQLEKWGLIEVHPNNRIKRKFLGNLRFRKEGPLGQQIESVVRLEFLNSTFAKTGEYFTFLHLNFVGDDLQKYKAKFLEIFKEMNTQSDKNRNHPNAVSYGITMAMRPWDSPFVNVFKRRRKNT
jgi:DNA-binding Xre family transcriptional regulator